MSMNDDVFQHNPATTSFSVACDKDVILFLIRFRCLYSLLILIALSIWIFFKNKLSV